MGLGRRTFAPGEVLTASNVMNYLMDQSVMNFAGTAARGSAIGTAVQEGMVTYLNDSNNISIYDGSAWKNIPVTIGDTIPGTSGKPFNVSAGVTAGNATAGSNTSNLFWNAPATVTFPVGRFNVAPIVSIVGDSAAIILWSTLVGAPTTSGFTFIHIRLGAYPTTQNAYWTATQMTSGTAAG